MKTYTSLRTLMLAFGVKTPEALGEHIKHSTGHNIFFIRDLGRVSYERLKTYPICLGVGLVIDERADFFLISDDLKFPFTDEDLQEQVRMLSDKIQDAKEEQRQQEEKHLPEFEKGNTDSYKEHQDILDAKTGELVAIVPIDQVDRVLNKLNKKLCPAMA